MRFARAWGFVVVGASLTVLAACSSAGPSTGTPSGASTTPPASPATIRLGETKVQQRGCPTCHGDDLSGSSGLVGPNAYAPNLTPDATTGIGKWTDAQLEAAIRTGVGPEGEAFCTMPKFADMDDDELDAIVAYLRSLKPVAHQVPASSCSK